MTHAKRLLFILMPHGYQDEEFVIPCTMLKQSGYAIDIAGFNKNPAIGSFGHSIEPNISLHDITPEIINSYAALIIPGGTSSPIYLWHNPLLQELVIKFHHAGCIIATICYACIVPVQAGILYKKEATVYPTEESLPILTKNNVVYRNTGCITLDQERIITAQGPSFTKQFGQAIITLLSSDIQKNQQTTTPPSFS